MSCSYAPDARHRAKRIRCSWLAAHPIGQVSNRPAPATIVTATRAAEAGGFLMGKAYARQDLHRAELNNIEVCKK